jgi:hypothetical protein
MKKKIAFSLALILACLIITDSIHNPSSSFPNGAPTGMTGSPGNGSQNCSSCHGSTPAFINGLITSDVPPAGYIPGQTYQFMATINTGDVRYGFSATVQDTAGNSYGTLLAGSNSQLFSFNQPDDHITHLYPDSSGQWIFTWQAPQQDSLNISIYASFVASDAGENDTVNHIKQFKVLLTSLPLGKSDTVTGAGEIYQVPQAIVFPSPATDKINISLIRFKSTHTVMELYSADGTKIKELYNGFVNEASCEMGFDISALEAGIYFIKISDGRILFCEKWVKISS